MNSQRQIAAGPAAEKQAIAMASTAAASCGLATLGLLESVVKHNVKYPFVMIESGITLLVSTGVFLATLKRSEAWQKPSQIVLTGASPVSTTEKMPLPENGQEEASIPHAIIQPRVSIRQGLWPALKDLQVWLHALSSLAISFPLFSFTTYFLALSLQAARLVDYNPPAAWQPPPPTASPATMSWSQVVHRSVPLLSSDSGATAGNASDWTAARNVAIVSLDHAANTPSQPRLQHSFSPCVSSVLPLLIPIALVSSLATIITHAVVARNRARRPPLLMAACLLAAGGYIGLYAALPGACAVLTLAAASLYAAFGLALTWTPHAVRGAPEKAAAAALLQVAAGAVGGVAGTLVYKMPWGEASSVAHLCSVWMLDIAAVSVLGLWRRPSAESAEEKAEVKDVEM